MTRVGQLPRSWTAAVREHMSGFARGDAALGKRVRDLKSAPALVRTAVLEIQRKGHKAEVYRQTLAFLPENRDRVAFAVFDASDERARVQVFGPNGQPLGRVRQHRSWENPWDEDRAEAFGRLPGQVNDDGEYAANAFRTHFGRRPG